MGAGSGDSWLFLHPCHQSVMADTFQKAANFDKEKKYIYIREETSLHIKTVNGARKVDVGKFRRMFCLQPPMAVDSMTEGEKSNMASSFVIFLLYEPSFKEWASENG